MIEVERDGDVAVVTMSAPPVNAMGPELLDSIRDTIGGLDGEVRAAVLTGRGRAFSAGVDLPGVLAGDEAHARRLVTALAEAFLAVATSPVPVVAAINGHAIAGGCVIACAADRRIVADGEARIGVTELAVGVPFPLVALEVVREVVGTRAADLVWSARLIGPAEALAMGLVDEVVAPEQLLERSLAETHRLAALPPATVAITKRQLRRSLLERLAASAATDDAEVADAWASDAVRSAMAAFAERTFARSGRAS